MFQENCVTIVLWVKSCHLGPTFRMIVSSKRRIEKLLLNFLLKIIHTYRKLGIILQSMKAFCFTFLVRIQVWLFYKNNAMVILSSMTKKFFCQKWKPVTYPIFHFLYNKKRLVKFRRFFRTLLTLYWCVSHSVALVIKSESKKYLYMWSKNKFQVHYVKPGQILCYNPTAMVKFIH